MSDIPEQPTGFLKSVQAKHGQFFILPNDIYIGRSLELYGEWCETEVLVFSQLLEPGATVIEAGANIGSHTVPLSRIVGPQGRVYAVEMQPFIAQLLSANIIGNGATNVQIALVGVSDQPDQLQVPPINYQSEYNFGGVSVDYLKSVEKIKEYQTVPILPLDELVQVNRLDLIKLDVEHMELKALRGAARLIDAHRPAIYLENDDPAEAGPILEHLSGIGYAVYWHVSRLFNPANHAGNAQNVFGNVSCVNMLAVPKARTIHGLPPAPDADSHPKAGR